MPPAPNWETISYCLNHFQIGVSTCYTLSKSQRGSDVRMDVSLFHRIEVPGHVLFREVGNEIVILDLSSERYFGLDPVGTRMWLALSQSPSIDRAFASLHEEFNVEEEVLKNDLLELVAKLADQGLVILHET